MPIISSDQTSLGGATIISAGVADTIFIREGVMVSHTGSGLTPAPAVLLSENFAQLVNAGSIFGETFGAVSVTGTGNVITVADTGFVLSNSNSYASIDVEAGATSCLLINNGEIYGKTAVGNAVGDMSIRNSGVIASFSIAISGATRVENTGTIQGQTAALMGTGDDTFLNRGIVVGSIDMGAGNDTFDGIGGTFSGIVDGGSGDDVYRTDDAGLRIDERSLPSGIDRVESTVSFDLDLVFGVENLTLIGTAATDGKGNLLENAIFGNMANNRLWGVEGDDTLDGGWGDDRVFGGSGNDALFGGYDNDTLRGGTGNDTITGGAEDDALLGDLGNDRLVGSDGDDTLTGGAGRDALFGGLDADTFRFVAVSDSAAGALTRDQINGFQTGIDQISLALIDANTILAGNQAFIYIGLAEFSATAGQLRAVHGTNSLLQGDVDGDGSADFEVVIAAVSSVSVNDLLL